MMTNCAAARSLACAIAMCVTLFTASVDARAQGMIRPPPTPPWTEFVHVEGQPLPVPVQWLQDPEARTTYDLKLPETVPKPVPFNFTVARLKALMPWYPSVRAQYFKHLCDTEAGEWIFKKIKNVEGIYFARPQASPAPEMLTDAYGPEMPWIQRMFYLRDDTAIGQGRLFIQPPVYSYGFVEQPRREVKWQSPIRSRYVRLYGYALGFFVRPGKSVAVWQESSPMEVVGTEEITAKYGYTWRGLRRERDREFRIAGGEVLIYDIAAKEILGVRRQFLISSNKVRNGAAYYVWETAWACPLPDGELGSQEFRTFAFRVIEPFQPYKTIN